MKEIYLEEKDQWTFSDRYPHIGKFEEGEFTQLLQKALEIINHNFPEKIKWVDFLGLFRQLQKETKSEKLKVKNHDILSVEMLSSYQNSIVINNNGYMSKENTYNQSGKIGIGHNQGDISGGTKVAGVINEAEQRKLIQAVTEIQQLLDQLAKDNPSETNAQKGAIADMAIEEIKNNPNRWQKTINVIKAMGIQTFVEAVNNPIFNIAKAGIETAIE